MELDWMGRYRAITAAMVLHGNVVLRTQGTLMNVGDDIMLTHQQWQILEYILENQDHVFSMIDISYRLNVPQSTFSKAVKQLCEQGLVEKYQAVNNRKNIILRPTDYGRKIYLQYVENFVKHAMQGFFDALDSVSDEALEAMVKAMEQLDNDLLPERKDEVGIIKLER